MCICIDGKQKAIVINQFPSLASPMASITLEPNLGNDIFFQPENDTPDMFEEGMRIMKLYFEPSHFVFQLNGICLACSIYINHYNPLEYECVLCVSYFIWEYKIIHTAGRVQIMQEKSKLNEMCTACIAYFGRANIHPTPHKWPNQRKVAHVVLNV